jgi:hypothetical protein
MTGQPPASPPTSADLPDARYDLDLYSDYAGAAAIGRGVRLVGSRIGWSIGDTTEETPLGNISYIHEYPASRANDIYPGTGRALFLNGYQIGFRNGRSVTVVDSASSSWSVSGAQTELFREFVAQLHHRLSPELRESIQFLAGYNERGKRRLRILLGFFAFLVVLSVLGFLFTREFRPLISALFGGAMFWRFYKLYSNN